MTLRSMLSRIFPPLHGSALYFALAGVAVACIVAIFLLQFLPPKARRALIVFATFITGLFYVLEFFWPVNKATDQNPLTFAVPTIANVTNVLGGFTLGLGVFSLVRIHAGNVAKQKSGWENSVVLLLGIVVMAVAGIGFEGSMFYRSLFRDVLNSFDAAMFAVLAFFIISAAYRAFRIRSAEATLLMAAALLVMLGQIPIGQAITGGLPEKGYFVSIFRLDSISNWILTTVNAPAMRAISFGLGVGGLAIALRIWLSLERGAYFEAQAED